MDIYSVLLIIAFLIHYCGGIFLSDFYPYIHKYGLKIMEYKLEKIEILNFSDKIGKICEKKYSKIKVISQNEFHIIPKYHIFLTRLSPYCIYKCINNKGEYEISSKLPITFLGYIIIGIIIFLIKKEITTEIETIFFLFSFFLIITLIINNWIMKFLIMDISEYLSGIEL
jgi:hypothetical protein